MFGRLLQRDAQNSYLAGEVIDEGPMDPLWGHSITNRIAVGPQAGRKVLTLQSLPGGDPEQAHAAGNVGGFSLHAGVAAQPFEFLARVGASRKTNSLTNVRLGHTPAVRLRIRKMAASWTKADIQIRAKLTRPVRSNLRYLSSYFVTNPRDVCNVPAV